MARRPDPPPNRAPLPPPPKQQPEEDDVLVPGGAVDDEVLDQEPDDAHLDVEVDPDDEEGELDDAAFEGQQEPEEADVEEPDLLERDPLAKPPVVAIVGRPNVGKSTLLNALTGSRVSIVEPTPGVTRDRVGVICTLADRTVEVVDTGGVGIVDAMGLAEHVERQVAVALASADVVLFVL